MIGIITDSTCDIPQELVDRYGIVVVPLMVNWGEKQYRDRIDLQPAEFYERIVAEPVRPHTSLPSITEFVSAFETAIKGGADELAVLTISSAMSGTYEMAVNALKMVGKPGVVIDSKSPTMGLGWQVLEAARCRDSGMSLGNIVKQLEQVRHRLGLFVGMDSMEFLEYGGRIGNAVRWAGSLLKVKPVVSVNLNTGVVEPEGLARTHNGMVDLLYKKFSETVQGVKNLKVAVLHGNVLKEAEALAERIRSEFKPAELLVNITGPVLGINTGPGALALSGFGDAAES